MIKLNNRLLVLVLSAVSGLISIAEDLPKGDVILDLERRVKTVENWEWPGWYGYAMKLTNGTLSVTGRMMPRHGRTDIYSGGVLKFEEDSVYVPGAGDAQPRWTVVHDGGTLDLSKGRLNPFNARFIIHPGGTVRLGMDLESRPHGNKWHVKGGKMVVTDHVILGMNEFFVDTNVVFEVEVAKGKYADFSKVTLSPGAKIKETGQGVVIFSHDDPRWKKSEVVRQLDRVKFSARGDAANRCYAIYFREEATNVIRRVAYKCPEFGIKVTRLPYFICRYPKGVKGPFDIQAVIEAKDGTRVRHTIKIPYNPKPIGKPFENDRFKLGVVSYGPGRERFEMVTNDLGNLYVRWGSWPQLLTENATEEWMKVAKEKDIYSMTIYASCPRDKRDELKSQWAERYLGNNQGERTGFFYGHRKEMRGPQDRNLKEAREWFLTKFFRGDYKMSRGVGDDPFHFATSGAAISNAELPAGIDFVCNELYAVGCANITYATAENRGAARKWGPEWWSGWLAHEWQTFGIPYDKDDKYLSLEAGIKSLWLQGTSLLCLESGSTGTQAHPYTWGVPDDRRKKGYGYDDDPPRRYRETIRKCNIFFKEHPRAKGTPETKIALAMGMYDGYIGQNRADIAPWAQHTNRIVHLNEKVNVWSCSHPEWTWDRAREVFFPPSGTIGVSGAPFGQVDIVGIDDMSRIEDLNRYSLLAFGGWNTMFIHAKKVLENWIENGGTCVMCLPQLSKRVDRDFLNYSLNDLIVPCQIEINGFKTVGDIKTATLKNMKNIEVVDALSDGTALIVKKRFGKGWYYLMLGYEFPGGNTGLGARWKKLLVSCAEKVKQRLVLMQENKEDGLHFFTSAVYPDKAYVMNLDMHKKRRVKVRIDRDEKIVELKPLEIREF